MKRQPVLAARQRKAWNRIGGGAWWWCNVCTLPHPRRMVDDPCNCIMTAIDRTHHCEPDPMTCPKAVRAAQ